MTQFKVLRRKTTLWRNLSKNPCGDLVALASHLNLRYWFQLCCIFITFFIFSQGFPFLTSVYILLFQIGNGWGKNGHHLGPQFRYQGQTFHPTPCLKSIGAWGIEDPEIGRHRLICCLVFVVMLFFFWRKKRQQTLESLEISSNHQKETCILIIWKSIVYKMIGITSVEKLGEMSRISTSTSKTWSFLEQSFQAEKSWCFNHSQCLGGKMLTIN